MKRMLPDPEWKLALEGVIGRLRQQVVQRPNDPEAWLALAMALDDAWYDHESMACYARALELAPGDERILRLMDGLLDLPEPKPVSRPRAARPVHVIHGA